MDEIPISILCMILLCCIAGSAFFSGSETGIMTLNRYRLRHRAKSGDKAAQRVSRLLEKPERLLGLLLLGNTFVNIFASAIATLIGLRLLGDAGVVIATVTLTLLLLIFGEAAPKTLAALHPERVADPAARVLTPLLQVFYPLIWLINGVVSGLLQFLHVTVHASGQHALSAEELRTVVMEAGVISKRHQAMLISILELEEITVNDIMVPRNKIEGVNLEDDWEEILERLTRSPYTRLLVYRDTIDQVIGLLHLRKVLDLMVHKPDFSRTDLESLLREPYFIPEGTSLTRQLLNFQQQQRRVGLVVDEYGDVLGLVTLEDILEEIVGEFTTDPATGEHGSWVARADGGYVVDGRVAVRTINRALGWNLPTDGPRTLNGLVIEQLEAIPAPGTRLSLAGHPIEVVETVDNCVKTAVIWQMTAAPEQGN